MTKNERLVMLIGYLAMLTGAIMNKDLLFYLGLGIVSVSILPALTQLGEVWGKRIFGKTKE